MSTIEIKLASPIEVGGITYDQVTVRDLSAAELRSVGHRNTNQFVRGIKITALATGLPANVLHELDPEDVKKISKFLFRSEV